MKNESIVPFGKYRGQPVEVMQNDAAYCDWLMAQDWFRDRHAPIYQLIVNNFGEPTETPEHNKLQALFLDDNFCMQLLSTAKISLKEIASDLSYNDNEVYKTFCESQNKYEMLYLKKREFECSGWDVVFSVGIIGCEYSAMDCFFEIKPCLSDDFPAVLRQMKANSRKIHGRKILIFDQFSAIGATLENIKQIFNESGFYVVQLSEIKEAY